MVAFSVLFRAAPRRMRQPDSRLDTNAPSRGTPGRGENGFLSASRERVGSGRVAQAGTRRGKVAAIRPWDRVINFGGEGVRRPTRWKENAGLERLKGGTTHIVFEVRWARIQRVALSSRVEGYFI